MQPSQLSVKRISIVVISIIVLVTIALAIFFVWRNTSSTPDPTEVIQITEIPDINITIGRSITISVDASHQQNQLLRYALVPVDLPTNATFDPSTGGFYFRPDETQVGEYNFIFSATDGENTAFEVVNLVVNGAPADGETALVGQLLDANAAVNGETVPLVGATIRHMDSDMEVVTDTNGEFRLTGVESGIQYIEFDGSTTNQPNNIYAAYRAEYNLIANVDNQIDRPVYLMLIDDASSTLVDPSNTTMVDNPNLNISMEIPPNTVFTDDGSVFESQISISDVPADFTPGAMPSTLSPSQVVTIQPMGLRFANPAPISFPNNDNLAPGSEVNLWSLDHTTGQFFVAGLGRVTADGTMIETIEGGVQESSWHFPLPPAPNMGDPDEANNEHDNPERQCMSSYVSLVNGSLTTDFSLPYYTSMGQARNIDFVYRSDWAYPNVVIPVDMTVLQRAAVPSLMTFDLTISGIQHQEALFVDTSSLDENQDERIRTALSFDASEYLTGVYPYQIEASSLYDEASVSSRLGGSIVIVNQQDSAFGAGWGIQGLQRIYPSDDGSQVLVVDGSGISSLFTLSDFNFPDLADLSVLTLNGSTAQLNAEPVIVEGRNVLRLTESRWQAGSAFLTEPVQLALDDTTISFTADFSFRIGESGGITDDDGTGADGIVFVISTNPNRFEEGGGIGYENIRPSIAVEFDTFRNPWDTSGNEVAITVDGNIRSPLAAVAIEERLNNDEIWYVWLDYDSEAMILEVRLSMQNERPIEPTLAADVDLFSILGTEEVFIGFTSGTGNAFGQHDILDWRFEALLPEGQYFPPDGDFSNLINTDDGFLRRYPDGSYREFNADGLQIASVNIVGQRTTYTYDDNGRLLTITDPAGLQTTFAYNEGLLSSVTDPANRVISFVHDADGNLTQVIYPDEVDYNFGYDNRHLITSETDARGFTITRTYDENGRIIETMLPDNVARSLNNAQSQGFLNADNNTSATAANPVQTDEVISQYTDGEGRAVSYEFGTLGQITSVTDALGRVTNLTYNSDGLVTQAVYPGGFTVDLTYDRNGNLLSFTDNAFGGAMTYTYTDDFNRLQTLTTPSGTTSMTYDDTGNLLSIESPMGYTQQFAYNTLNQVIELIAPDGIITAVDYNASGNPETVAQTSDDISRSVALTYTPAGNIATLTDYGGRLFSFEYDSMGMLTSETLPAERTISYSYDANNNLVGITTPNSNTHAMTYNGFNIMTSYTAPPVGDEPSTTTYSYNAAQELTLTSLPDGRTIANDYDPTGRLLSTTIERGAINYTWNDVNYLSSISAPDDINLEYEYQLGIVTGYQLTGTIEAEVDFTYQEGYLLDTITAIANPTSAPTWAIDAATVSFDYNADNALTRAGDLSLNYNADNGYFTGTTLGAVTDNLTYSAFGNLADYDVQYDGSSVFNTQYERDIFGRITQLTETIDNTTIITNYDYDDAGRLISVTIDGAVVATYTYDANGNRLTVTADGQTLNASYDAQDRLRTYGDTQYSYNANGDLTASTSADGQNTYIYDEFGNLMQVTLADGQTISYLVDGRNRRVGRMVDGELVQGFVYQDSLNPILELDGNGQVVSRFVYGSMFNVPDYMIKDGIIYRIISDHLGSVRLVINIEDGTIAQRMDYDAWGNVIFDSNAGFQPFGYAGGLYDPATSLVRFGARDYDAEIGRWTTKDPIGFAGGDTNLYAYVSNNPVNLIDPTGTFIPVAAIAVGGGIGAIVGGVISGASYLALSDNFTWKGFAGATAGGAVSGAIAGATKLGGPAIEYAGAFVGGYLGHVVQSAIDPNVQFSHAEGVIAGTANMVINYGGNAIFGQVGTHSFRQSRYFAPRTLRGALRKDIKQDLIEGGVSIIKDVLESLFSDDSSGSPNEPCSQKPSVPTTQPFLFDGLMPPAIPEPSTRFG